uniref:Uncharacterized protein n=1 Tax=Tanacetum cinerariifolium TaxID=118510 RepID=A0A699SKB2_TANCI|nr:hypothetical protein [Tanacetum cinerariifolium]
MSWVSCSCTAASSVTPVLTPSRVVRGDVGSGGDGICGNGDDNRVSGDGERIGIAKNLSASSLVKDSVDG